jgi:hypothetical protein
VKLDQTTRKGYRREDLYDAWQRYATMSATSATSATSQLNQVALGRAHETSATEGNLLTSQVAQVAEVADTPSGSGETSNGDAASMWGRNRGAENMGDRFAAFEDGRLLDPGPSADDPARWTR